jgi:hypothetical protein
MLNRPSVESDRVTCCLVFRNGPVQDSGIARTYSSPLDARGSSDCHQSLARNRHCGVLGICGSSDYMLLSWFRNHPTTDPVNARGLLT